MLNYIELARYVQYPEFMEEEKIVVAILGEETGNMYTL